MSGVLCLLRLHAPFKAADNGISLSTVQEVLLLPSKHYIQRIWLPIEA